MYVDKAKQPQRGSYLVVMGDYLTGQDVAESIEYYDPSAVVIVRHSMAAAIKALEYVQQIKVAFVGDTLTGFGNRLIAELLVQRGARIVRIGDAAEAHGDAAGWRVLQRPFSMAMVHAHLEETATA